MAVPVVILGAAGIAALTGVGTGANAIYKNAKASDINEQAQLLYEQAKYDAEKARDESNARLEALGRAKLTAWNTTITRFVGDFEKIHNIELTESVELNELGKLKPQQQTVLEVHELGKMAMSVAKGVAGGVGAGALAVVGAYGAASTFGVTATTGVSIATLSGVAASNATMAFLGGGAIAAGGGGMALGSIVLGGAAAGPAIAVLGIVMNASASKNLDNAYSQKWQAEEIAEGLNVITALCNAISDRALMFELLLEKLGALLDFHSTKIESILENCGTDYGEYSEADQGEIAMALSTASALKQLLDTPILNEDGSLTRESQYTATELKEYMDGIVRQRKEPARQREAARKAELNAQRAERMKLLNAMANEVLKDKLWSAYKNETSRSLTLAKLTNWEVKDRDVVCFFDLSIKNDGSRGFFITADGLLGNSQGNFSIKYEDIDSLEVNVGKILFLSSSSLIVNTKTENSYSFSLDNPFYLKKYLEYAMSLPPLPSAEDEIITVEPDEIEELCTFDEIELELFDELSV